MNNNQINNLVNLLDGYVQKGGHHLNVNVLNKRRKIMEKTQKEYSIQEIGEYIIEIKKYYGPTSQEYTEAYNTWKSIMRIIELKENIK